jgi:hypothetical protein
MSSTGPTYSLSPDQLRERRQELLRHALMRESSQAATNPFPPMHLDLWVFRQRSMKRTA